MKYCNLLLSIIIIQLFAAHCYAWSISKPKKLPFFTLNTIERQIVKRGVEKYISGRSVVINNSYFKKEARDALGRTNCQRMISGLAPIGIDDSPINLHHLHQENDGILIEMLESEHHHYNNELHSYKANSEINRQQFNIWKQGYWKERGLKLCR